MESVMGLLLTVHCTTASGFVNSTTNIASLCNEAYVTSGKILVKSNGNSSTLSLAIDF